MCSHCLFTIIPFFRLNKRQKSIGRIVLSASEQTFLTCMFCFPISHHVMVPLKTVFFQLSSCARASTCICRHTVAPPPPRGAETYMGYIGMCRCEGYGFQAVYSRIGYIHQRVWVSDRVSFFRKLISWLKINFIQTRETTTLGQGEFGEFTLVQGSKIQLNQLWYR